MEMPENGTATPLRWSAKESLLQYVRALGEISYDSAVVEQGNELVWPLVTDHHEPTGLGLPSTVAGSISGHTTDFWISSSPIPRFV